MNIKITDVDTNEFERINVIFFGIFSEFPVQG